VLWCAKHSKRITRLLVFFLEDRRGHTLSRYVMEVSHPFALLEQAEGTFEGAVSKFVQTMVSSDTMELGSVSRNVSDAFIESESGVAWITGKLTISF
jgi:hypothetical protein